MSATPTTLVIGDDWLWDIVIKNSAGAVVDLTAYTIGGEFYTPNAAGPLQLTVANGRIILANPSQGEFLIRIEDAVTQTVRPQPIPSPTSRVQVYLTDASGNRTTAGVLPVIPRYCPPGLRKNDVHHLRDPYDHSP